MVLSQRQQAQAVQRATSGDHTEQAAAQCVCCPTDLDGFLEGFLGHAAQALSDAGQLPQVELVVELDYASRKGIGDKLT